MQEDTNEVKLSVSVDTSQMDEAMAQFDRLNDALEKANSLLGELALQKINLSVNVED